MSGAAWQKALELSCSDGMLELADRFGFDLADSLAGHFENAADLFERVGVAVADAVAKLDDFAFAVSQCLENLLDLVLEHFLRGRLHRIVPLFHLR